MTNEKGKANPDAALKTTAETQEAADTVHESVPGADTGVVTTEEELDASHIVRAIEMELVSPERSFLEYYPEISGTGTEID